MKRVRLSPGGPDTGSSGGGVDTRSDEHLTPRKHWRLRKKLLVALIIVVAICAGVRALLPWAVRDYVNRTLDRNLLYSGKVGTVKLHIWRGAYSIHDIQLNKTTADVPVPFFAAKAVDFSVQWGALFHGKVVGQVTMLSPQVNFVDAPTDEESQTGSGGPWLQVIRDLFPFQLNSVVVHDGSVHFRTYQSKKPVDVYLSQLEASIDNLGNVRHTTAPLAAKAHATAKVMDQANLDFLMTLDPFSYHPTFHLALRLLGLDVTRLNDLALTYGKFDFKRGWLDLVIEADSKEGQMTGYVKPLFRDLKVFDLRQDVKEDNVLQVFWQALIGGVTSLLKNRPRDQFGTLIPFSASVSGTSPDILATVGNVLRNAFIRAYLPRLEGDSATNNSTLQFQPPSAIEGISTGQ